MEREHQFIKEYLNFRATADYIHSGHSLLILAQYLLRLTGIYILMYINCRMHFISNNKWGVS